MLRYPASSKPGEQRSGIRSGKADSFLASWGSDAPGDGLPALAQVGDAVGHWWDTPHLPLCVVTEGPDYFRRWPYGGP